MNSGSVDLRNKLLPGNVRLFLKLALGVKLATYLEPNMTFISPDYEF
jgi:hypothetical protein